MGALRNWIAPTLLRALDEHLELTKPKSIHVEDDLSHLYIYCNSVEFVQVVEWLSTASDTTAIFADTKSSIRAVFPRALCSSSPQNLSTSSLLKLKPGTIFRLTHPEVRISNCFDPVRVELWVKGFTVVQKGDIHLQGHQLVEVNTLSDIRKRLNRFVRQKLEDSMAQLGDNAAINSSPGLRSQASAEEESDLENTGGPLVSQTNFATQVPFSPPKPLMKSSPQPRQLLGKRKATTDLRQLLSDSSRPPKKKPPCAEDHNARNAGPVMQTAVEQGETAAISDNSLMKSERQSKEQDISNSGGGLGTPSNLEISLEEIDAAEDNINSRESPPRIAVNPVSEMRIFRVDDRLRTLSRWPDRLSKTKHLPRYLQKISKSQNDLLAADDKWQPALVGHPNQPGTLPLDLLNRLTKAADQKAAVLREPAPSVRKLSEIPPQASEGEDHTTEDELDLPSNSTTAKHVVQRNDQSPGEARETESNSEGTSATWSPSPPRSFPLRRMLPPDSSPVMAPQNMSIPSPPAGATPLLDRKSKDSVLSGPVQPPSTKDNLELSQRSRRYSSDPEDSVYAHITKLRTPSNLQSRPNSRAPSIATEAFISPLEAASAGCSNAKPTCTECADSTLGPTPVINSSDYIRRNGLGNIHLIQESDTQGIITQPPSSTPPQTSYQVTDSSLTALQKQPASQRFPLPPLSPQLIPGTFMREPVDSWPTDSLRSSHEPKDFVEESDINSTEDRSLSNGCRVTRVVKQQEEEEETIISRQAMMDIQSASKTPPIVPGGPNGAINGSIAYSDDSHFNSRIALEDRVTDTSDFDSLNNHRQENTDKEFPTLSKPTKSTIAGSVLSVSSEEPDFIRVNNMTRQYRRVVYSSLRKIDTAAPLPPSTALASSVSSKSESIQSGHRRHSAQTSPLRPVTTSTSLTCNSSQAPKVYDQLTASTPEISRRSSVRPKDQFLVFQRTYPTYGGTFTQFLTSCRIIKKVRTAGKLLPQGIWDDFVYRHSHDYRSYLHDITQSSLPESPISYPEYYADYVSKPVHLRGVLKVAFIDALSVGIDSAAKSGSTPLQTASEIYHLPPHRRSVAVSNSTSNIRQEETLDASVEGLTAKDMSITLETQLQLMEQEDPYQIQSSPVRLWLQKASNIASPELGTPGKLAAQGDIPRFRITQDEEEISFDLSRKLQNLKTEYTNTSKVPRTDPMKEARWPDAKTEPFKYFTLGQARLDVNQYGIIQIQARTKGALRPDARRIVDVFMWRG